MKCTFRTKNFAPNLTTSLSYMLKENNFSDVTLVSDDEKSYQAHKFILSAASPVLKNIFLDNPHSHPLIYLRGIYHQELYSILTFIYLGEVNLCKKNIRRFLQIAKELQIRGLNEADVKVTNAADDNFNRNFNSKDKYELVNAERISSSLENPLKYESKTYPCLQCKYKASQISNLKRHQESIHKGIKYSCKKCKYQATQQIHLTRHQNSVHEGVKYFCDQCEFQGTTYGGLKMHQRSIHEGIKYPCQQCDYVVTRLATLNKHQKDVHGFEKSQSGQMALLS